MDSNNRGAGSIPASILRDKINEMYDHLGDLSDTKFRLQVLNALYVVADQLDRLETPPSTVKAPESPQNRLHGMSCTCVPITGLYTNVLCPTHGDARDTSMDRLTRLQQEADWNAAPSHEPEF